MTTYAYRGTERLDAPSPEVCWGVRGTVAGYGRHKRTGERPCDACRDAMNTYNRMRQRRWVAKPSTRAADRDRRRARARAWAELAKRHPEEYATLLRRELGRIHAETAR